MATISVVFKPVIIDNVTTPYYHEFLLYTPDNDSTYGSDIQYFRGGPDSNQGLSVDSGGGSGSSGVGSGGGSGPNVPFGQIITQSGVYETNTVDYPPNGQTYQSEVITSGPSSQLDAEWSQITQFGSNINSENIPYSFGGPNSNSVVSAALEQAGLPLPTDNSLNGSLPAPGADVPLSESTSQVTSNLLATVSDLAQRGLQDIENDVTSTLSTISSALSGIVNEFVSAYSALTSLISGNGSNDGVSETTSGGVATVSTTGDAAAGIPDATFMVDSSYNLESYSTTLSNGSIDTDFFDENTGYVNSTQINFLNGTSQEIAYDQNGDNWTTITDNYSGIDGSGEIVGTLTNYTSGYSNDITYDEVGGNWASVSDNYSGLNDSGNLTGALTNFTNGTSQDVTYDEAGGNWVSVSNTYSGLNDSGSLTDALTNFTNGTSNDVTYDESGGNWTSVIDNYSGLNDSGNLTGALTNFTNGTSQDVVYDESGGNWISVTDDYSGLNDAGNLTGALTNLVDGGSQDVVYDESGGNWTSVTDDYSGPNDSGELTGALTNLNDGTSQDTTYDTSGGNWASVTDYYSESNDAGSLTEASTDNMNGTSSVTDYGSWGSTTYDYDGLNGSGALSNILTDNSNGTSVDTVYDTTGGNWAEVTDDFSGQNDSGTLENALVNYTDGTSQDTAFDTSGGNWISVSDNYTGQNDTGDLYNSLTNLQDGASIDVFTDISGGNWSNGTDYFTGPNDTGELAQQTVNFNDGESEVTEYSSDEDYTTIYSGLDGTGSVISYPSSSGSYSGYDDGDGSYGYSGGYSGGFGGYDFVKVKGAKSLDGADMVAQYDTAHGNASAAMAAMVALVQAKDASLGSALPQVSSTGPVLEGEKWGADVITWSIAASANMTAEEQQTLQQALKAWAAVSDLTFVEMPSSSVSDVVFTWGNLDTSSSGVAGYTSYNAVGGTIQPGATIYLENPNQTALVSDSNDQLSYAGTDATFYQVALHEIGHALGLADNADPNSVMYFQSSLSNATLDATDVAGVQSLYGAPSSGSQSAMAWNASSHAAAGDAALVNAIARFSDHNDASLLTMPLGHFAAAQSAHLVAAHR